MALLVGLASASSALAEGTSDASSEPVGFLAGFKLDGSNGYAISAFVSSERADGKGQIAIAVGRRGQTALYVAPATVTATTIHADLGPIGRIDVALHLSAREKTVRRKCSRDPVSYEPGRYEGTLEFNGEGGYTRASQSMAPLVPVELLASRCAGNGEGEETGGFGLPGARLRGLSFAHGRKLSFQLNKNRRRGRTVYTASVDERRRGITIERTVTGTAPPAAFDFESSLRTATVSLPAPFSGQASLRRSRNSVLSLWNGDLSVSFPGRPNVRLASPDVHVSLVHARFTRSDGPSAEI